jgi:ABC-type branched-subunit amino acid transport system substrate-binding protein
LGAISDFTGPFAIFGRPLVWGHEDFWAVVNAEGGVDGFDVYIGEETVRDGQYNPTVTVEVYNEIRDSVAMLAESLGTPHTQAALPSYAEDDMVAAVSTWWSGFSFPEYDQDLIIEVGASYCIEAMNAYEFVIGAMQQQGKDTFTFATVGFEGDYGGDAAAGIKFAAAATGVGEQVAEFFMSSSAPDVEGAVATLVSTTPDVVFLTVGPTQTAQVMGGTFQAGHQTAMYVGTSPSFHPVLFELAAELAPLLEAAFFQTSPYPSWDYEAPGYAVMRAQAEARGLAPDPGYIAGWVNQYAVKAVLEQAIANGDLTRAGIAAAVGQITEVDFQGILPSQSYGVANDTAARGTFINRPVATANGGIEPVTDLFTGQVASAYDYSAPCFAP